MSSNWRAERHARRLPREERDRRDRGRRHALADAPHPRRRRADGGDRHRRTRTTLVDRARAAPPMEGRDLTAEVTCAEPHPWTEGTGAWALSERAASGPHVVAIDFGDQAQHPALLRRRAAAASPWCRRRHAQRTCSRSSRTAIFLSNGPGDPAAVAHGIETVAGARRREADVRHLPGAPDPRARARRLDLQAQVRPPRSEPTGERPRDGAYRGHDAKPRLRRGPRVAPRPLRDDARSPQRRDVRGRTRIRSPARSVSSTIRRRAPARTTRGTCSDASWTR